MIRGGAGPAHASPWLRSPVGLAAWIHAPSILGWLTGAVLLAGSMGSLAQQFLGAVAGNRAFADALGVSGTRPEDGFLAMTQLYLAVIGSGYAVQTIGSLHAEETTGRLEPRLAGTLSRRAWLTTHGLVVLAGLVLIDLVGSAVLGLTTAWSVADSAKATTVLAAGAAYLPAELLLAGVALAVFGLRPRAFPVVWAVYAVTTFVALLGPGLQLPRWARDLAPTTHTGNPPLGAVGGPALGILAVVAVALMALALLGFRRRGIPQS
jgi:ABC-2 type transport system permease protein